MKTFEDDNLDIPVYVPEESIELYQTAEGWKEFTNILALTDTAIDEVNLNKKKNSSVQTDIRDGHIFILRDGKTYTMQGQEVR